MFTRLFQPWDTLLINWKMLAVTHTGNLLTVFIKGCNAARKLRLDKLNTINLALLWFLIDHVLEF